MNDLFETYLVLRVLLGRGAAVVGVLCGLLVVVVIVGSLLAGLATRGH
jgi:hypothetical protein